MKEVKLNIWDAYDNDPDCVVCVTVNGYVKKNGEAVMGRGTAAQAAQRWQSLSRWTGRWIKANGNTVQLIVPLRLLTFPVKPAKGTSDGQNVVRHMRWRYPKGSVVPGWAMKADLALIKRSLARLAQWQKFCDWERVYLPRPGCGAGELDWETQVRPLCERYGDWLLVAHI